MIFINLERKYNTGWINVSIRSRQEYFDFPLIAIWEYIYTNVKHFIEKIIANTKEISIDPIKIYFPILLLNRKVFNLRQKRIINRNRMGLAFFSSACYVNDASLRWRDAEGGSRASGPQTRPPRPVYQRSGFVLSMDPTPALVWTPGPPPKKISKIRSFWGPDPIFSWMSIWTRIRSSCVWEQATEKVYSGVEMVPARRLKVPGQGQAQTMASKLSQIYGEL